MSSFRVIIVANGECRNPSFYRSLARPEDYVICADGGTCHALAIGLQPRLVIGDFDSLDGAMRRQLAGRQVEFHCYPCEKDQSDLELALERAVALRPREIMVFCALGGPRLEQILANIFLLVLPLEAGIPAAIVDERHEVRLIEREVALEGERGDYLSLFPLTQEVHGVETEGLKYPLYGETLYLRSTRGLSNEFAGRGARVKISGGRLLVIKTRRATLDSLP